MDYIYGRTPPMLGAKNLTRTDQLDEDVIFYGVPWEGANTWGDYTSSEMGPKQIRISSERYSRYLPEFDHIDLDEHLTFGDVGDVSIVPNDSKETADRIEAFTENLWRSGKFIVGLGGDHSISYPVVKAITNTGKKVGIIHMDAHYDNMDNHEGDKYARNTPFMRLYETEGVRNESLIHTGIHGPRNKPETGKNAKDNGAVTITINDIKEASDLKAYAREIYDMAAKDVDVVYLTICSDVLDFAFNPGGPIDTNGLSSYELLTMIHEFGKKGLVGMDYVEVYPQSDPNQSSSHLVSTAVLYVLAGHVIGGHHNRE